MNVVFLAHNTFSDRLGGADRSMLGLIDFLRERGVGVEVIAPRRGAVAQACEARAIPVHVAPYPNNVFSGDAPSRPVASAAGRAARRLRTRRAARAIAALLRERCADVVHSNSVMFAAGALASRTAGLPHVWHVRESVDFTAGACDWPADRYAAMLRASSRVIAISDAVRARLHTVGVESTRIYNGVLRRREFDERARRVSPAPSASGPTRFVLIGGITPRKGQDLAVRAFAGVRAQGVDARLTLVGAGDVAWIERVIDACAVRGAVTLAGPSPDPWGPLADADALLMCSTDEAMGRVTVEAMAACVPVIGRRSGATPELIEHGRTGLLFDDERGLADAMLRVCRDRAAARDMAFRAHDEARQRFSIDSYGEAVLRVYDEVSVGAGRGAPA